MTTAVDKPIPAKLKSDAIIEAIFEIRFDTTTILEILFGRLADFAAWKGFDKRRLPAYEIPDSIRQLDPKLRYTAVFELHDAASGRSVRIGAHVLSYHQMAPYVGWTAFKPELLKTIEGLFVGTENLVVKRLGFRYINALRADLHGIGSILDLDMNVTVAGAKVPDNVNVNFTTDLRLETNCTVRIATTDFIQGELPATASVVIDVDVFTKESFKTKDRRAAEEWVEFAHTQEKEHFFRLLTEDTINVLKEN